MKQSSRPARSGIVSRSDQPVVDDDSGIDEDAYYIEDDLLVEDVAIDGMCGVY